MSNFASRDPTLATAGLTLGFVRTFVCVCKSHCLAQANLKKALVSAHKRPRNSHKKFDLTPRNSFNGGIGATMAGGINQHGGARAEKRACAFCGSAASLKDCGRCRQVCYCCGEHQKAHWKTHKVDCTVPAKTKAKTKAKAKTKT